MPLLGPTLRPLHACLLRQQCTSSPAITGDLPTTPQMTRAFWGCCPPWQSGLVSEGTTSGTFSPSPTLQGKSCPGSPHIPPGTPHFSQVLHSPGSTHSLVTSYCCPLTKAGSSENYRMDLTLNRNCFHPLFQQEPRSEGIEKIKNPNSSPQPRCLGFCAGHGLPGRGALQDPSSCGGHGLGLHNH